jgi:hypothetical protein
LGIRPSLLRPTSTTTSSPEKPMMLALDELARGEVGDAVSDELLHAGVGVAAEHFVEELLRFGVVHAQ